MTYLLSDAFKHAALIVSYLIALGLVLNLLFSQDGEPVPTLTVGLILLIGLLIATKVSDCIWHDAHSTNFIAGPCLALAASTHWSAIQRAILVGPADNVMRNRLSSAFLTILIAAMTLNPSTATASTLHLIEVVPPDADNYTVKEEMRQIQIASEFARSDFTQLYPNCVTKLKSALRSGSDEELYNLISTLAVTDSKSDRKVLVGLSRSSFAKLGAKAALKTELKGVSIGAATARLSEINPNFISVVSPWTEQWAAVKTKLKSAACDRKNSVGIFDEKDALSLDYKRAFDAESGIPLSQNQDVATSQMKDARCIFIGMSFSSSLPYLSKIAASKSQKIVIGTGDWNYFADELKTFLSGETVENLHVFAPTGWTAEVSPASTAFATRLAKVLAHAPSPVAAYAYDGTMIGLSYLCNQLQLPRLDIEKLKSLPLLRKYEGLTSSNNLKSKVLMIDYSAKGLK